jgi:hypothetical protein
VFQVKDGVAPEQLIYRPDALFSSDVTVNLTTPTK